MTTKDTNAPKELAETTLDDISGGPHFRNFHGAAFDFQAASTTAETTTSSGHYTQIVWAKT